MLKREQQEVLSLLKEIDTICKKHGISYFLSPLLTLCAENERPFPQNPLAGAVVMKVPDMEKFRLAFEKESPKRRALESMDKNPRFPGFYLRYVNVDTLCYRLTEGRNFQYPGLGIDIIPLREIETSKVRHGWNRVMETGWQQMTDLYSDTPRVRKLACRMLALLMCLGGRKRFGRRLYRSLAREGKGTDKYVLRIGRYRSYYFPKDIFAETEEADWAGERFSVPADRKRYLKRVYGADYKEETEEDYKPSPYVMVSTLVGCEKFFQEYGSQKALAKAFRRRYLEELFGDRCQKYYNWCWKYARLCASERRAGADYARKKDMIKNLYKNNDYMRLENIFRPYTKMMQRCLKEGEIFVPDEELLKIYMSVLEHTGNIELKKQIEKLWG